jgi:hypothetical protein
MAYLQPRAQRKGGETVSNVEHTSESEEPQAQQPSGEEQPAEEQPAEEQPAEEQPAEEPSGESEAQGEGATETAGGE